MFPYVYLCVFACLLFVARDCNVVQADWTSDVLAPLAKRYVDVDSEFTSGISAVSGGFLGHSPSSSGTIPCGSSKFLYHYFRDYNSRLFTETVLPADLCPRVFHPSTREGVQLADFRDHSCDYVQIDDSNRQCVMPKGCTLIRDFQFDSTIFGRAYRMCFGVKETHARLTFEVRTLKYMEEGAIGHVKFLRHREFPIHYNTEQELPLVVLTDTVTKVPLLAPRSCFPDINQWTSELKSGKVVGDSYEYTNAVGMPHNCSLEFIVELNERLGGNSGSMDGLICQIDPLLTVHYDVRGKHQDTFVYPPGIREFPPCPTDSVNTFYFDDTYGMSRDGRQNGRRPFWVLCVNPVFTHNIRKVKLIWASETWYDRLFHGFITLLSEALINIVEPVINEVLSILWKILSPVFGVVVNLVVDFVMISSYSMIVAFFILFLVGLYCWRFVENIIWPTCRFVSPEFAKRVKTL